MADHKRQDPVDEVGSEDVTRTVGSVGGDNERRRVNGESSGSSGGSRSGGLADRLSEILVEDGDGDLLMQQSDRETNFLQWLQALDLQVMGACRADERLKPLLKVNGSSGPAEDRLLAYLCQHFEATEVGLLARCLCVPLVSMRVGKIVKQGPLLCPTSTRGNLNLTLLPSSDLRISFVGDDGHTERLATLSDISECSTVAVEEIPADESGRSFLVKISDGKAYYFWCSEKSKLLGADLLSKMKDLLKRKPTLAGLTGISESRLDCFATHLRSYLVGSSLNNAQLTAAVDATSDTLEGGLNSQSSPASVRLLRSRHSAGQPLKHAQSQISLSPRSSSFKEGPRTLSTLRSSSREKLRRRGDLHLPTVDSSFVTDAAAVVNLSEKGKDPEASGSNSASSSSLSFLESLGKANFPLSPLTATSQFPPIGSLLSPYYCWCPPCASPSMVAPMIPQLPNTLTEPFSLPPLSTLLPTTGPPNLLAQIPPLDLSSLPPLEFPAFPKQTLAQQIPTFTPLMCDPIVHIPIVDVCSSGQGYLVSAGPTAIATSIPPLHPKLVGPIMPEGESMVEKGARETLRLLIGGSSSGQPSASSIMGLPAVVLNSSEDKPGVVVTGSRGLYCGSSDVDAIVNSFAAVGLASLSERSMRVGGGMKCWGSSSAACSDVVEQSSSGLDFQDSTFISREEEKD